MAEMTVAEAVDVLRCGAIIAESEDDLNDAKQSASIIRQIAAMLEQQAAEIERLSADNKRLKRCGNCQYFKSRGMWSECLYHRESTSGNKKCDKWEAQ